MSLAVERPPDVPPKTRTRPRRSWWRFRLPWRKTAVSAPTNPDELLIVNDTDVAWGCHLGYRHLGPVDPGERRLFRVVKAGMLSARQIDAPVGSPYLTIHIGPHVRVVEIVDLSGGEGFYELRTMGAEQESL